MRAASLPRSRRATPRRNFGGIGRVVSATAGWALQADADELALLAAAEIGLPWLA